MNIINIIIINEVGNLAFYALHFLIILNKKMIILINKVFS